MADTSCTPRAETRHHDRASPDTPAATSSAPRSRIKPSLLNLSTSGTLLSGAIVERNRESSGQDQDSAAVKAAAHLLVLHRGPAARLDWRLDGARRQQTFDGQAILNPQGLFLAPRWQHDVELALLALDPHLVNRVGQDMGRQHVELIPRVRFDDATLDALVNQLLVEVERDAPADRVYAQSLIYALVTHLVRHYSVSGLRTERSLPGLPPAVLARTLDYMREHLDQAIALEDLAGVAGFSPSHFTAMFRRATGLAPHQYLMARRVEHARALLTATTLPIADVAVRSGFADQSHLTRVFKRHVGLTPRLVRGR